MRHLAIVSAIFMSSSTLTPSPHHQLIRTIMSKTFLVLVAALASAGAFADSIDAPSYKTGDTWVYQGTVEKGPNDFAQSRVEVAIVRATASTLYYTSKTSGAPQAPRELISGIDWSRMRNVNGKEIVVNRPLAFPLTAGKSWNIQYSEQQPNKDHKLEQWSTTYTVVGTEPIEVPAGKFTAIKIEAEGTWVAELEPKSTVVQGAQSSATGTTMVTQVQKPVSATATGRTYKAFWYVPAIKRWVKSVEEYYSASGQRTERYTDELVSFRQE